MRFSSNSHMHAQKSPLTYGLVSAFFPQGPFSSSQLRCWLFWLAGLLQAPHLSLFQLCFGSWRVGGFPLFWQLAKGFSCSPGFSWPLLHLPEVLPLQLRCWHNTSVPAGLPWAPNSSCCSFISISWLHTAFFWPCCLLLLAPLACSFSNWVTTIEHFIHHRCLE